MVKKEIGAQKGSLYFQKGVCHEQETEKEADNDVS
jgi:hypothetical protein